MKNLLTILISILCYTNIMSQNIEMVTDINPNGDAGISNLTKATYSSGLQYVTKLFFTAKNETTNYEAWISDGTESGTNMLKDINLENNTLGPANYTSVGLGLSQKVIFSANGGDLTGQELWSTSGTSGSTVLLSDINPGSPSSYLSNFFYYNFKAYFAASNGVNGIELWVTNGTGSGTYMIKDIYPGTESSNPSVPIIYNNKLYFSADSGIGGELWCSDGTEAGTTLVKEINPGADSSFDCTFFGCSLTGQVYDGLLYFSANDGVNGYELWVTDGTTMGTMMIKNINSTGSSNPKNFIVYNNKLYFTAFDDSNAEKLWSTDGTTAGTQQFLNFINFNNQYECFTIFDNKLYFFASNIMIGRELWASDGTTSGTYLVKDINPNGDSFFNYPYFTEYNNYLYFKAKSEEDNCELYRTDGTEAGTISLAPAISPNSNPLGFAGDLIVYNNALYFSANFTSHGIELWKLTDTTTIANNLPFPSCKIYPNPAQDYLKIEMILPDLIEIYNIYGQLIKATNIISGQKLYIGDLPKGMYLLTSTKNNFRERLVIE